MNLTNHDCAANNKYGNYNEHSDTLKMLMNAAKIICPP